MFKSVRIEKPDLGVMLKRLEVRNAHDPEVFRKPVEAFDEVENDPDSLHAVLAGATLGARPSSCSTWAVS